MPKFRLSRRAVLRGVGSIAVALPWLEIMEPARKARAAGAPAQRFLAVFTPGGTLLDKWRPTGTESAPVYGPILKALDPVKGSVIVLDGVNLKSASGDVHQGGMVAWMTGTGQVMQSRSFASGPSIDQVIATRISAGKKSKPSIEMAIRWATGISKGRLDPRNAINFQDAPGYAPIAPRLDPQQIWKDLFGSLNPASGSDGDLRIGRKKSMLDFLDREYAALSGKLGAADKAKLEQHLTKIRELEKSLAVVAGTTGACKAPAVVDTSDYNPMTALNSATDGSIRDATTDAAIPKAGRFFMDLMVMALACDITAVGTLQWCDSEAKHTFPWLNLNDHHHFYQHDGGFKPAECEKINTWYVQQHAYLLKAMAAVDMGGHTLLDESVVFFGSEIQDPPTHGKNNMPFLLAGNGGGLRTGRWIKYGGVSHNDLLVSLLNLFGDPRTTFGDPKFCTGPLPGLT